MMRQMAARVLEPLGQGKLGATMAALSAKMPPLPSASAAMEMQIQWGKAALERVTERATGAQGLALRLHVVMRDEAIPTVSWSGIGTLAMLAERKQFVRVTTGLYHVHAAMEGACDASPSPAVRSFWDRHGELRRADALANDLKEVGAWPPSEPTLETLCYVRCVEEAARSDAATDGGRLLAHIYARHLFDLGGADTLSGWSRYALGLGKGFPQRFEFDVADGSKGPEAMTPFLAALNEAGNMATDEEEIVYEGQRALRCNSNLMSEPGGISSSLLASLGLRRLAFGYKAPTPTTAAAADTAASTKAAAVEEASAAENLAAMKRYMSSRPRTRWDVLKESGVRAAALNAIDVELLGSDDLRACAAKLPGNFGDEQSAPLVAALHSLADSKHELAAVTAKAARTDARRAWLVSEKGRTNQANLAGIISALGGDQIRKDGPHAVMIHDAEKEAALAELEAKEAKETALTTAPSPEQPRRVPYCGTPWDSRGLDGGSVDKLRVRAEGHHAELSAEIEAAVGTTATLEKLLAEAAAQVAHGKDVIAGAPSGGLLGVLRESNDKKLQAELARLKMRAGEVYALHS